LFSLELIYAFSPAVQSLGKLTADKQVQLLYYSGFCVFENMPHHSLSQDSISGDKT